VYAALLVTLTALTGQAKTPIKVPETDIYLQIKTDVLQARINKKGYDHSTCFWRAGGPGEGDGHPPGAPTKGHSVPVRQNGGPPASQAVQSRERRPSPEQGHDDGC
jgi:hypothetical protein